MLLITDKLYSIVLLIVISSFVIYTTEARPSETSVDDVENDVIVGENETETDTEIETGNRIRNGNEKTNISNVVLQSRISYSNLMKQFMDQTTDPCDDFYKYACGNWNNTIIERQTQHKRNYLSDIIYKLLESVEDLLFQKPNENFAYRENIHFAAQLYNSCLTANLLPLKKSEDYLNVIRSIGGFPAVDKETWKSENFNWFNMTSQLSIYGINSLVLEKIIPEYPFPPYFLLPELGFDLFVHTDNIANSSGRGYVLNEQRMRSYLTTYGVSEEDSTKVIDDIFEFWRTTLAVMDEFDENVDQCNFFEVPPFTKWNDYFAIVWNNTDFNVTEDDCPCEYFYVKLDKICSERKEAVANYLAMKFLYSMDAKLKDVKFQKEFCLSKLHNSVPYIIDHLYMLNYFNKEIQDELFTIIDEIRKSLRIVLNEASWLDEPTRFEAFQKESTIIPRVGKFENNDLERRLIQEMNNIHFLRDNYEQNNINLMKFRAYLKRYMGLHKDEFAENAKPLELLIGMQVNAFYYSPDNSINIMAGILHPPAYHKHWPNSLKFGTIGYLIGHEFTHGFDSVGAHYDSNGTERYWWSDKSRNVFDDRSTCYVNHYNSYRIPQINRNINGNQTLDENLADSGGIREAYIAYRKYIKGLYANSDNDTQLEDEQMPGLDLSPDQLFFVGFAQLWCSAYKEEDFWEELTDEHTIDRYRVLGTLTNSNEFAKAYNCPIGSKMNPNKDKCRLW